MAPYSSAGPSHLDSHDSSQLLNGLKTAATSVWETRIKLLCCCIGKDDHTRVAFSSTAELFSTYFSVSRGDLVWFLSSVSVNASDGAGPSVPIKQRLRTWCLLVCGGVAGDTLVCDEPSREQFTARAKPSQTLNPSGACLPTDTHSLPCQDAGLACKEPHNGRWTLRIICSWY